MRRSPKKGKKGKSSRKKTIKLLKKIKNLDRELQQRIHVAESGTLIPVSNQINMRVADLLEEGFSQLEGVNNDNPLSEMTVPGIQVDGRSITFSDQQLRSLLEVLSSELEENCLLPPTPNTVDNGDQYTNQVPNTPTKRSPYQDSLTSTNFPQSALQNDRSNHPIFGVSNNNLDTSNPFLHNNSELEVPEVYHIDPSTNYEVKIDFSQVLNREKKSPINQNNLVRVDPITKFKKKVCPDAIIQNIK